MADPLQIAKDVERSLYYYPQGICLISVIYERGLTTLRKKYTKRYFACIKSTEATRITLYACGNTLEKS